MTYDPNVFGYVDGQPTYSRDEFIYKKRRRGPITDDAELVAFAEKVTSGWYNAGWRRTFTTYYLGDYALDEPLNSMTLKEYNRLKELQKKARDEAEAAEAARCWQHVETIRWADNSVEEVYKDKDGNIKRVMDGSPRTATSAEGRRHHGQQHDPHPLRRAPRKIPQLYPPQSL